MSNVSRRIIGPIVLAVALALGLFAGAQFDLAPGPESGLGFEEGRVAAGADTGGSSSSGGRVEFGLIDQHGKTVSATDLQGNVLLVFFGYTHCPDVCPTTLLQMREAKAQLGERAGHFKGIFITVDPARDTQERLREYVGHFDQEFLGLTGAPEQIASAARSFGAFYERGEDITGGYLMGHTAFGYLVTADGQIDTIFPNDAGLDEIVAALERVLPKST